MSSPNTISVDKLHRLIGLPKCPHLIDVRTAEDFEAAPSLIPGAVRRDWQSVDAWASAVSGDTVVVCQQGLKLSHGVAAWLRHAGVDAVVLDAGMAGWLSAGMPVVPAANIPRRDAGGRTVWVTRSRPKIDRIACPWLIRRFIDRGAVFLFVAPSEVKMVGERFAATPFDIEDTFWSHRGPKCTFDTMVEEFGLATAPVLRLAAIVRAADTAVLDGAAEASGLLAVSLGLSRMFSDDLEQLDAGMLVYDALYRWCRDATDETHNWPAGKARTAR
ncbi:MAG: sulfurtransferase/chromate resistance protein [Pseudomonadota bacterium]|nr:sulfurtransferase/chromate resistance protein [Pseudomonadota bacterium]